jgi:4-aminobutyrate aminotransferase-like enzyme
MVQIESTIAQKRQLVTELPGPRSRQLATRRTAAVAPGVSSTLPLYIEAAEGAIVVDVDGNSLIDLGSGIAVTSVGHALPAVVEAVREQVGHFTHTCFMVGPYEGYVAVCEELNARTPGAHDKTSALFNSGAEAVENAVKVARHATGRQAVIVFDHAYHGRTNLTMALTAKNMPYKDGFGPFAPEVYRVPMSYPFRDPAGMTGPEAARRALEGPTGWRASSSNRCRVKAASSYRRPVSCRPSRRGAPITARSSSPTRSSPGSAARATGSPASTRASSRIWSRRRRGSQPACPWPGSRAGGS